MNAVALMGVGDAQLISVDPPEPVTGELLLQVDMVGLCGTDLNSYRGLNPLVRYPRIIGHEVSGTVIHGTEKIPSGSRVAVSPYSHCGVCPACLARRYNACVSNQTLGVQRDGALKEFLATPESKVYPSTLSARELCIVEPLTVGFHAVDRGRVADTDTVAVFGCGGVGLGVIAGAAFRGANVIAIDVDETKLAIARRAGAGHAINSSRRDPHRALIECTNGRGPDVVIDAVGLPLIMQTALETVAQTGRIVFIGYTKVPVALESKLVIQKEIDLLGSRNALPPDFRTVINLLEKGKFPLEDVITAVAPLEEAPALLKQWAKNPSEFTKIMIDLRVSR